MSGPPRTAMVPLLSRSRPSPTRLGSRLRCGTAWSLWGRSAWCARFGRCPGGSGLQADPVEDAPTDWAGAHLLLQPGDRRCRGRSLGVAQGLPGLVQEAAWLGGGVEARVADFPEPWRQDMLDQAVEELHRLQGGRAAMLGAEGHLLIRYIHQSGVGDAHPVGVAPEIGVMWCTT